MAELRLQRGYHVIRGTLGDYCMDRAEYSGGVNVRAGLSPVANRLHSPATGINRQLSIRPRVQVRNVVVVRNQDRDVTRIVTSTPTVIVTRVAHQQ
jgi:hypothetical protein